MAKLKSLFVAFLTIAASAQKLGINLIRVAILVIFVWIGGLKFWNYEAEGIVPFVANSPFMSFFYTKDAPEYKEYKLKEGELDETKHLWHEENNTYGFSHGLGILIMGIRYLDVFRHLLSENRFGGGRTGYCHDIGHFVFPCNNARGVGPRFGKWRTGIPSADGRRSSGH